MNKMDELLKELIVAFFQVFLFGVLLYFVQRVFSRMYDKSCSKRKLQENALIELSSRIQSLASLLDKLVVLLTNPPWSTKEITFFNNTFSSYREEFGALERFWRMNKIIIDSGERLDGDFEALWNSFARSQSACLEEGKLADVGNELAFQLNGLPQFGQAVASHLVDTR